ncbi:MAG: thioredoxin domain-containing protein [Deltaproteobacteria bacterium]|nr:thioredoxin domain-containing protein [Deltaproteobacteria bacterium]
MAPNRLAAESSPYLRQHAHNPVDWWPWCDEALALARRENRLILLSVGYSACHWCHVMAHECFESPDIAATMNEHFVNVKVDREERPDVDQIYQTAVQLMRQGHGGWPLTVFLTPSLEPVWGATYLPPAPRHGLPSLPQVLRALADAWAARESDLREQAAGLIAHVEAASRPTGGDGPVPDAARLVSVAHQMAERVDPEHGGFGGAPKFPHASAIQLLLRAWQRSDEPALLEAARRTLDGMAAGGIHDQLGGGFHRYSTDEAWLVPHFEKMLYDNAGLLEAYAAGWQATGEPRYAEVCDGIVGWLLREMEAPGGGFHAAQDADSEGEEGRFFAWSREQIAEAVPAEDADLVCACLGVYGPPTFEGRYVLHRPQPLGAVAERLGVEPARVEERFASARAALFRARASRPAPGLDDKLLTAWNGQMIGALAEASTTFARPDWLAAAQRAAERFAADVVDADGTCRRQSGTATPAPAGTLDDSAWLAWGLLRLAAADGSSRWLDLALRIAERMIADFHDPGSGGWFVTRLDTELTARLHSGWDGAMPSGASIAAELLAGLAHLTGREELRELALGTLRSQLGAIARNPLGFSHLLLAADLLAGPVTELVFAGSPDAVRALLAEARRRFTPRVVVGHVTQSALDTPLRAGRVAPADGALAWVCRDRTCELPTSDPKALARALTASA